MRRFRNPRYAPESLERKLSPSGFTSPPADVSSGDPASDASSSSTTCDYSQVTPDTTSTDDASSSSTTCDYSQVTPDTTSTDTYATVSPGDPPPSDPDYPQDPEGPAYSGDHSMV